MEIKKGITLITAKERYKGCYVDKCVIDFITHEVLGQEITIVFLGVGNDFENLYQMMSLDELILYYQIK